MSIQLDLTTGIDCPVEEVFEFVTTVENDEQWHPRVVHSPPVDGTMEPGATWRPEAEGLVGTSELTLECTEYDPPSKFGYRTPSGMMGGRLKTTAAEYTFTENGDGTQLQWSATIEVNGVLRLLTPLLARMVRNDVETSLTDLKSLLESAEE